MSFHKPRCAWELFIWTNIHFNKGIYNLPTKETGISHTTNLTHNYSYLTNHYNHYSHQQLTFTEHYTSHLTNRQQQPLKPRTPYYMHNTRAVSKSVFIQEAYHTRLPFPTLSHIISIPRFSVIYEWWLLHRTAVQMWQSVTSREQGAKGEFSVSDKSMKLSQLSCVIASPT